MRRGESRTRVCCGAPFGRPLRFQTPVSCFLLIFFFSIFTFCFVVSVPRRHRIFKDCLGEEIAALESNRIGFGAVLRLNCCSSFLCHLCFWIYLFVLFVVVLCSVRSKGTVASPLRSFRESVVCMNQLSLGALCLSFLICVRISALQCIILRPM